MSKLTSEARNAILSARAKNRKAATALVNADVVPPKAVLTAMRKVEDWANAQLAPAAKATAKADPSETHDTPIAEAA